jgi:uncharacterized protein YutD
MSARISLADLQDFEMSQDLANCSSKRLMVQIFAAVSNKIDYIVTNTKTRDKFYFDRLGDAIDKYNELP